MRVNLSPAPSRSDLVLRLTGGVPQGQVVSPLAGRAAVAIGFVLITVVLAPNGQTHGELQLGLGGLAAVIFGVLLIANPALLPLLLLDALLVVTDGLLVFCARYDGPMLQAFPALYIVIGTVLFSVRSPRAALIHLALVGASFAGVLAVGTSRFAPVSRWFGVFIGLTALGLFLRSVIRFVVFAADQERAQRDQAEAASRALEEQSLAKTRFMQHMNHELRTPLNAVLGFADLLAHHGADRLNERQLECVRDIADSSRHLVGLVDEALDIDHIEAGALVLVPVEVDIARLIEASIVFVRPQAIEQHIRITVDCAADATTIVVDRVKTRQILVNLLANAVRFSPEGGEVIVRVTDTGSVTTFSVIDSGPGIPERDRNRIFEEFTQIEPSTGGTGLGLPLSRRFAELHGGRLDVESEPGHGSAFRLELPTRDGDASEPTAAQSHGAPSFSRPQAEALERTRVLAAWAQASIVGIAAGTLILIGAITPFDLDGRVQTLLTGAVVGAVAYGMLRLANRLTFWQLEVIGLAGVVAVTLAVTAAPEFQDITPLGYLGLAIVAFATWPPVAALRQLVLIGIGYAIALSWLNVMDPVTRWVTLMIVLAFTAEIVLRFSGRGRALLSSEQVARREAQETLAALDRTSRHKAAFVANMSHELRTPLNAIIGFSELLRLELLGPVAADHLDFLEDISQAAGHLLAIINDILETARVEAGRLELDLDRIDVPLLIETVVAGTPGLDDPAFTVSIHIDPELPPLVADELRVRHALAELVGNAVKFSPDGGRITISARGEGNAIRLSVSDEGIGIASDQLDRVFDAFHQGTRLPADYVPSGTGLGLSLAKSYVELLGGRVSVTSTPELGSTFVIDLPAVQSETASARS